MTDIVERLRREGKDAHAKHLSLGMWKLCDDAAAEIERLRDALRNTVENLENMNIGSAQWIKAAFDVAAAGRAALVETKE